MTAIGHHDHHLLQKESSLSDKLEEHNLVYRTLEFMENYLLHVPPDTGNGTALLPYLETNLAGGLLISFR